MRIVRIGQTLSLIAVLAAAVTCRGSETTAPPAPSTLALVSGSGQNGTVGQALGAPLVVLVHDQFGNPMSGVAIGWTVTAGGGNVSSGSVLTDAQGHSSVTWALGTSAGNQSVTATLSGVSGSPVMFSANAVAGPATTIAFGTQPVTTGAGSAITPAVTVVARDAFGNTATTFTSLVMLAIVTDPGGTPVGNAVPIAGVAGIATFSNVTVNTVGCYRLVAGATAIPPVTSSSFCITDGPAAAVAFTVQPTNASPGVVIAPPVQVTVQDGFGNTITAFNGNVTVSIGANPGSGTLSGTLTKAAVNGVATFSDLSIDNGGTGYTLHATAGTLPQATSAAFNIKSNTVLVFTTQPTNTTAGSGSGGANGVQVTARDTLGATLSGFTGSVTVTVVTDPGGASTGKSAIVSAVAGVATFSTLVVNTAGCYRLIATSTSAQTATSNAFCISAAAASQIAASGGNGQTALAGTALPVPYSVTVTDAFGNAVSGVTVDWAATSGGGSMSPAQNATGSNGVASSTHTLGASPGSQTATATATGLAGSPVPFSSTATSLPAITTITPDTLVEGQAATITGTGFSATPGNNTVLVGGVAATVNTASVTQLSIMVPSANCQPARDVGVTVVVGAGTSNVFTKRLHPSSLLNLAVGQQLIVQDPSQFCLQFRPSTTGGDEYLVGVGAAAETPTSTLPFTITTVTGATGAVAPFPVRPLAPPAAGGRRITPDPAQIARQQSQLAGEQVIRGWERAHLDPRAFRQQRAAPSANAVAAVPSVGDTLQFKVADFSTGFPCTSFTTIKTVVRAVGTAGIWVTDVANPTLDSLTAAQIQGYSDTFDLKIYAIDTLYFGKPSDLDLNQRIVIVLTIQVNKDPLQIAGFVFGGDLFNTSLCAASNGGELFYGQVPDAGNASGTGARTQANVLAQMPSLIAHEFTHDIQLSRRLLLGGTAFLSSWEAEGQAVLAEEVVGHSVLGNSIGQNYGASVALAPNVGDRWYGFAAAGAFQNLPMYFGWIPPGPSTKAASAPELCTLFGTTSLTTPCYPFAFYGASWSFQRYMADRFGPGYSGGETALNHDLIGKNVNLAGTANVAALLGVQFDSLFSQWGAMLYVDDRALGLPPALEMTSWNLPNVFAAFVSDAFRLVPVNRTFTAFSDSRSVRGGSNAYTLVSAAGARPALALRVRDNGGAVLGATLKPQLWIVRIQ